MSGSVNSHVTGAVGVAADITVHLPFTPGVVRMYVDNGAGGLEVGVKTYLMAGSAYLSTTTGTDAGVTIGDRQIVIANGADVNVVGETIHIIAEDNYQD